MRLASLRRLLLRKEIRLPRGRLRFPECEDVLPGFIGHGIRGLHEIIFQRPRHFDRAVLQAPPEEQLESLPIDGRSKFSDQIIQALTDPCGITHGCILPSTIVRPAVAAGPIQHAVRRATVCIQLQFSVRRLAAVRTL